MLINANKDHSLIPKFEIKIRVAIKLPNTELDGPKQLTYNWLFLKACLIIN